MGEVGQNAEIVRCFVENCLGQGDLGAGDATMVERIKGLTGLKPTGPIDGREEYKQTIAAFVLAFPAESPLHILAAVAGAPTAPAG